MYRPPVISCNSATKKAAHNGSILLRSKVLVTQTRVLDLVLLVLFVAVQRVFQLEARLCTNLIGAHTALQRLLQIEHTHFSLGVSRLRLPRAPRHPRPRVASYLRSGLHRQTPLFSPASTTLQPLCLIGRDRPGPAVTPLTISIALSGKWCLVVLQVVNSGQQTLQSLHGSRPILEDCGV